MFGRMYSDKEISAVIEEMDKLKGTVKQLEARIDAQQLLLDKPETEKFIAEWNKYNPDEQFSVDKLGVVRTVSTVTSSSTYWGTLPVYFYGNGSVEVDIKKLKARIDSSIANYHRSNCNKKRGK